MNTSLQSFVKEMQRMGATAGNFMSDTDEVLFYSMIYRSEGGYCGAKIIYVQWVNRNNNMHLRLHNKVVSRECCSLTVPPCRFIRTFISSAYFFFSHTVPSADISLSTWTLIRVSRTAFPTVGSRMATVSG